MKMFGKIVLSCIFSVVVSASSRAQEPIVIQKAASHLIPVSIVGFTGEAQSVLTFDLSVLGIVTQGEPEYIISGKSDGHVEGSVTMPGSVQTILSPRAYSGGSIRSQAHAFANDIVKALRQTSPIFQTKIAFRLERGVSTEICVSDFDGFNPVVVTHDNAPVAYPSWMPGSRTLFYTSWMRGDTRIYEHNLSTGSRGVFAGYPGSSFSAEVSPDRTKVAMILSKGGSPNLYVADINGGNLRQLTMTRDEDSSPCWSADSREICFVCRSGRAILEKISVDGGESTRLPVGGMVGANLTSPDWSPDGTKIAFTSGSRPFNICVMSAAGGDAEALVAGEDPSWAPNSRTIIFTQRRPGKRVLCLLDVPTKHVKDVRTITGSCSEPSWAR